MTNVDDVEIVVDNTPAASALVTPGTNITVRGTSTSTLTVTAANANDGSDIVANGSTATVKVGTSKITITENP